MIRTARGRRDTISLFTKSYVTEKMIYILRECDFN